MKKIYLSAILMAMSVAVNAQTPKSVSGNHFSIVPSVFCYDGKACIAVTLENSISIYNDEIEFVRQFIFFGELLDMAPTDYDNGSYVDRSLYATQTLFNTDEKFEFVVAVKNNDGEITGIKIMSEDNTILQTIMFEEDYRWLELRLIKINNKKYLNLGNYFYRIDAETSSVKPVSALPVSVVRNYSIDGRPQPTPRRGINISRQSDGTVKKYVVR